MSLHIGWPQFIWILMVVGNLAWYGYYHNRPRPALTVYAAIAVTFIEFWVFYFGGFFHDWTR